MGRRNAGLAAERRMDFRIGINLCDIMADEDDIYGDGVNIAARIEALAEPGGICVTGAVRDQTKGKVDIAFEDLGEHTVKNIAEPVRVWRVRPDAAGTGAVTAGTGPNWRRWAALAATLVVLAVAAAVWLRPWAPPAEIASEERMAFPLPDKPSIAVMPFDNLSGDAGEDYIADGITEDITTALSQVSNLFVIARTSAFVYKGRPVKVQRIAEDLGVRYVLEGSVQRSAGKVRRQGAPARCAGKVRRQGAPARCAGKVRRQGAPARCAGKVRRQGAPARCGSTPSSSTPSRDTTCGPSATTGSSRTCSPCRTRSPARLSPPCRSS